MKTVKHISLRQLIAENKFYLLLGVILLVINKGATMLIPYTSKFLIDEVIINNHSGLLVKIILVVCCALVVQAVTYFALTHFLSIKAQEKIAETRTQFFHKVIHLPISHFKKSSSGQFATMAIADFESIRIYLGVGFVQIIGGCLSIVFALSLMFFLNFRLSLYILTPLLLFCIIIYFIYKKQKAAFKHKKAIRAQVLSNLIETFRNIKVVKGFQSNAHATGYMEKGFIAMFNSIKKTLINSNFIISLSLLFIGCTSIIVMWVGGNMAISGEISIGELTTLTIYLAFLIAPIYQITKIGSQFTDAKSSIERINEVLALADEDTHADGKKIILSGKIILRDVSFAYDDKPTLSNINLEIRAQSTIAIVGKSGAGKTTLTDLIAGFYEPGSGSIMVDDHDLKTLDMTHYRKQIGFVFQETFLFNGSIKENIRIAKPEASDQEIEKALHNANAMEFISKLPDGIQSYIGEGGSKLSEGQKQRLAIARAFLVDPQILILDEATSNLDAHNEKLIAESIARLMQNRTIISVAHRLDTIINADQIVVMDKGQICESGTHDELMRAKGFYYQLQLSHR
ncbi:MAG: ABC transporter ATP-binding protein [Flavobacteriales bacterium]|nr:ABC transporter ATP-binding protein [Flavobacteriales bacterium]